MQTREREITRVTLAGSAGNAALTAFKFAAGILGHSSAMVADALHSLSDFLTDLLVVVFVRISGRPQDEDHDYGHGKFETMATLFVGIALFAAAVGIIVTGATKVAAWARGETLALPGRLALWAALISIAVKEGLYRYTAARGRALQSPLMVANAWHHRSDALSSIGAAAGIGGALLLGERWAVLDPVASLVVGAMLLKVTVDLLRPSLAELTDGSLSPETEAEILSILGTDPAVHDPHHLRTRRVGRDISIDVHVRMDGEMSLREAHDRVSRIETALKERFGKGTFVSIHMEPSREE